MAMINFYAIDEEQPKVYSVKKIKETNGSSKFEFLF